jgi:hypothetical protein
MPAHRFEHPTEPKRRVPTEPSTGTGWAGEPNVELLYLSYETLEGTAAGEQVALRMEVPHSHAGARGAIGGDEVAVTWAIGDNSNNLNPSGTLRGSYAGQPVYVNGVFHLEPSYLFDHAEVEGRIAGRQLTARIQRASGGFGSFSTVAADGTFGDTPFTLYGTVNSDLTKAVVAGTVEDQNVRLDIEQEGQARYGRSRDVRISGNYHGPMPLLVAAVGTTLYFI